MDMLSRFFTQKNKAVSSRKGKHNRDKTTLRKYAENDFWRWVASWSRAARMPSDLGFDNDGFVLPQLIENDIEVEARRSPNGVLPGIDPGGGRDAARGL